MRPEPSPQQGVGSDRAGRSCGGSGEGIPLLPDLLLGGREGAAMARLSEIALLCARADESWLPRQKLNILVTVLSVAELIAN